MQKCPSCGFNNRPGVVFCENCGTSLLSGGSPLSTKALESDEQKDVDPGDQPPPSVVGSSTRTEIFPVGGTLRLEIEGSPEPIYLGINHREIVLGRRDPATGALPDVDLTPFAGYRMGVSRRHSQIRHSEEGHLDVFDLGSSNGTFLNGRRLEAHYPYRLRDGDKLALGQIVIRVYFEKPAVEAEVAPAAPAMKGTGTKPLSGEPAKPEMAKAEAAKPEVAPLKPKEDKPASVTPEAPKPTTIPPGSLSPLRPVTDEVKAEQISPQPSTTTAPSASVSPAPPKLEPKPAQPEAAKPEITKSTESGQPEAEKSKPAAPQPPTSPPLGTVTKPAGTAKPEAEKPKQPTATGPFTTDITVASNSSAPKPEVEKVESTETSPDKKAEESKDSTDSKPDSSSK